MQLQVSGSLVSFPTYNPVSSFDDMSRILEEIPAYSICEGSNGTGNCRQIYYLKKSKSGSNRCRECQIAHTKEYDRLRKREKRARERLNKKTKETKNAKQQLKRRNQKVRLLIIIIVTK